MIAAEHQRHAALGQRLAAELVDLLAHPGNLADVALALVACHPGFGDGRVDVAVVEDVVPEQGQPLPDARDSQGRGAHVDAAAAAAKVHADADDVDGAGLCGCHIRGMLYYTVRF